jgi:hypothetical protein
VASSRATIGELTAARRPIATGEEIQLLPRTTCVHDGTIESLVIDASAISGKQGQLTLSVFAGRTGLRDDAALISGRLVQLT